MKQSFDTWLKKSVFASEIVEPPLAGDGGYDPELVTAIWASMMGAVDVQCDGPIADWRRLRALYFEGGIEVTLVLTSGTWLSARSKGYCFTDVLLRTSPMAFRAVLRMSVGIGANTVGISGLWRDWGATHPDGRGVDISWVQDRDGRVDLRRSKDAEPTSAPKIATAIVDWAVQDLVVSQALTPWELFRRFDSQPRQPNRLRASEAIEVGHRNHVHLTPFVPMKLRESLRRRVEGLHRLDGLLP